MTHRPHLDRTSALSESAIGKFRARLRGTLLLPGDAGYAEARRVWNGLIDRQPTMIARCAGVSDIQQAIGFAREHDLLLSVRGGGHSYPGYSVSDGGLMLDLSQLKRIRIDRPRRQVRAEPGVLWGELDQETHGYGLAVTGSQVSHVGIAGLTLGGGLGWLMRKWGLTCDNLLSADVVSADGKLLIASADENPDLFWGLRGGGGNFGVVTSFEYQFYELDSVYGGLIAYPLSAARSVLQGYRGLAASMPDELSTTVAFVTLPDGQRAVALAACYAGDLGKGESLLQPLRSLGPVVMERVGPMPYPTLQSMLDQTVPPGSRCQIRSHFLDDLEDGLIDLLAEHYSRSPSPLSSIVMLQMGGAVSRIDPLATAFYYRHAAYSLNLFATWKDPGEDDLNIRWHRALWEAVQPFLGEGVYVNTLFDEGTERVRAAYGPAYPQMLALKRKYDPDNLFRLNQNIRPL